MSIRRHIAVVLCAGVWMVAGLARAEIRPSPLPSGWPSLPVERPFSVPEQGPRERGELLLAQGPAMPPEQRQQMRQQMREHWQMMPPEQRQERRQESRGSWQQIPSEERQRMREEMRERGAYGEGRHSGRGDRR